jgi:DNA-directed RNA polymerase subunit RPC12/RpoP
VFEGIWLGFLIFALAIFVPILIILLAGQRMRIPEENWLPEEKCSVCGKEVRNPLFQRVNDPKAYMIVTKYTTGEKQYLCRNCVQKEILDKQGTCPHCNKPMIFGKDAFGPYTVYDAFQQYVDNKWYHKLCLKHMSILAQQHPAIEKTITKEVIVKVRCQYCNSVFDETLDKCPYCGGKR